MTDHRRLSRRFFARPSTKVAPELLGRLLVRRSTTGALLVARIVETEAYEQDDPASHAFRGVTARNAVMFGPPGHLYVYVSYGMHLCMNVTTGRDGEGNAVLLRAAEPLEGRDEMGARRGTSDARLMCAGPGRLTQALDVNRDMNGEDLVESASIWVERGRRAPDVSAGPRVGISRAIDRPWRFLVANDAYISRARGG